MLSGDDGPIANCALQQRGVAPTARAFEDHVVCVFILLHGSIGDTQ